MKSAPRMASCIARLVGAYFCERTISPAKIPSIAVPADPSVVNGPAGSNVVSYKLREEVFCRDGRKISVVFVASESEYEPVCQQPCAAYYNALARPD